jgi:transcriptional regulator with XRE-family HTH domain
VKAKPPKLDFPQHLAALRKQRTLTQQALAERIGVHVVQLRRYESGSSQPTLEERGPDDELKLQFEAVSRLDPEEKKVIRSLLDSMILRHEAKRWSAG